MGITGFSKWLMKNYPESFTEISKHDISNIYDYVYIDINYLLHFTLHSSPVLKKLLANIKFNLSFISQLYQPTVGYIFCIDGIAPIAKLVSQKNRRYTCSAKSGNAKDTKTIHALVNVSPIDFTPGTFVMNEVMKLLYDFQKEYPKTFGFIKPKVKIIGPDIPGEGEIKIFNEINLNEKKKEGAKHLVVSSDSDSFVQAIICKSLNIFVGVKKKEGNFIFSSNTFIKSFLEKINKKKYSKLFFKNNDLKSELTFVFLLLGNDYWKKINVSLERIFACYFAYATQRSTEYHESCIPSTIVTTVNGKSIINIFQMKKLFLLLKEKITKTSKAIKILSIEDRKKKVVCYLNGLLWCLDMYLHGQCANFDYCYEYDSAPSVQEILWYLDTSNNFEIYYSPEKAKFFNKPMLHEIILLPPNMRNVLMSKEKEEQLLLKFPDFYGTELCDTCASIKKIIFDSKTSKAKITSEKKKLKKHISECHDYEFTADELRKVIEFISNDSAE